MKPFFLATVSAAVLSLGAGLMARHRSERAFAAGRLSPPDRGEAFDAQARKITRAGLQFFVVPVWLAAGIADWWCHRRANIETTTGLKESVIHLLMIVEVAAPILAAFLLEIDPLILSAMIAVFFLHEATAMWDVSYAVTAREVTPLEQHVHSFLEMIPLLAVSLIALMHWPQLKTLAGLRTEEPRGLRLKSEPISVAYIAGALGSMALGEVLPYVEEAVRDWRANPDRLTPPSPAPGPAAGRRRRPGSGTPWRSRGAGRDRSR